ncbi:MAG: hypothetical protein QOI06_2932 [Nocardioidaceae bacterium]|nr:hypothetical protein [Nocardioidaceae bacterium]
MDRFQAIQKEDSVSEIGHAEIKKFAKDRVNLPKGKADDYRDQVNRLRERLEAKIRADPAFDLVKMLHCGSVAKGTALKTVNDLDVAVYVRSGSAPVEDKELLPWLADRLADANPNMKPSQFEPQDHCVKVSFAGSGLDVDVAPVLHEGDANDCGYLVRKYTGERVLTSVSLHLAFIRKRKDDYGDDFKQLIRLTKWWRRTERQNSDDDFRFKSFMIELIWAHLADGDLNLGDYPEAMRAFFTYLVKTELSERIFFTDNYKAADLPAASGQPIEIFDPVNPNNNVAINYEAFDRKAIVEAAHRALDAIGEAQFATTKSEAVAAWRDVLGPSFGS